MNPSEHGPSDICTRPVRAEDAEAEAGCVASEPWSGHGDPAPSSPAALRRPCENLPTTAARAVLPADRDRYARWRLTSPWRQPVRPGRSGAGACACAAGGVQPMSSDPVPVAMGRWCGCACPLRSVSPLGGEVVRGSWAAAVETLQVVTPRASCSMGLGLGLHTFGDHSQVQAVGDCHHRSDQGLAARVVTETGVDQPEVGHRAEPSGAVGVRAEPAASCAGSRCSVDTRCATPPSRDVDEHRSPPWTGSRVHDRAERNGPACSCQRDRIPDHRQNQRVAAGHRRR
ncbi:hypothetical protein FHR75_004100 [Kineococcus radiotolerans]|uniref:Uncharacterized protein n=1 Tax=Kineococcus radiotolerans TaxID=131568 RepID=A0A7W4XYP0_KINRA|nr:hypothetical protein [Kineococcus radiotolerans]